VLDEQDGNADLVAQIADEWVVSAVSRGFMPAVGSSSSSSLGLLANARAISSRRWSP